MTKDCGIDYLPNNVEEFSDRKIRILLCELYPNYSGLSCFSKKKIPHSRNIDFFLKNQCKCM